MWFFVFQFHESLDLVLHCFIKSQSYKQACVNMKEPGVQEAHHSADLL